MGYIKIQGIIDSVYVVPYLISFADCAAADDD